MTSESDAMNVNVDAVHDSLDLQVSKGLTAVEAAGESLWLAEVQAEQGVLSRKSREDLGKVVNEWLAQQVGGSSERAELHKVVAELYARFLKTRVSFEPGHDAVAMLEAAWREWRAATRG